MIELLDPKLGQDAARIADLKTDGAEIVDTYDEQLAELAEIREPSAAQPTPVTDAGEQFAYYPWRHTLARIVGEAAYQELRTNRNKNLLTAEEQESFAAARVGFAGLNVGNPGAVCVALEGGARKMKLADLDALSLTNLNRFRAGLPDLGVNKATLTAHQILEIDPYYEIELHDAGIQPQTVDAFLGEPKLDVLVEEMDALPLKIMVRESAKRLRVPVVMVTGNSEGVLLDVERYDTDPDLPILNGLLDESVRQQALAPETAKLSRREKAHLARAFVGKHHLEERLNESFEEFGRSLAGIPQLAESSFLRGAVLCFAVKAIILGRSLDSGRYAIAFDRHMQKVA